MKIIPILTAAAITFATQSFASIYETNDTQRANLRAVEEWTKSNSLAIERGILLDKTKGEVVILAEHCEIHPSTTIEFPVIGELSDRDYEALFRTFARPGAIGKAIELLGVAKGQGVDFASMNYWPKGERVAIDIMPYAATNGAYRPLQSYILDMKTRAPLAAESFIYCGSKEDPEAKGKLLCDTMAPNSVVSTYNEAQTLIDMPIRCPQGEVYERFVLTPNSDLVPFALYKIRIRPVKRPDGKSTFKEYDLFVTSEGGIPYFSTTGFSTNATVEATLTKLQKEMKEGYDLYLRPRFDEKLTIKEASLLAQAIEKIDSGSGLRITGPKENEIYYKGFMPNQAWRIVKDRPSQPWAVHFIKDEAGKDKIKLIKTIEDWTSTDSLEPILSFKEFIVETPEEVLATFDKEDHGLPVILIFAPEDAPLSTIMPTVRLLKEKHPTVYIFGDAAEPH